MSIINDLLILNPEHRKDASELLKNPIFDSIRVPSIEKEPEYECECIIDYKFVDEQTGVVKEYDI